MEEICETDTYRPQQGLHGSLSSFETLQGASSMQDERTAGSQSMQRWIEETAQEQAWNSVIYHAKRDT